MSDGLNLLLFGQCWGAKGSGRTAAENLSMHLKFARYGQECAKNVAACEKMGS